MTNNKNTTIEHFAEMNYELNKLINKFALKAKRFIECGLIPDGTLQIMSGENCSSDEVDELRYSNVMSYDHDYFALTKGTKSLLAIQQLIKCKDVSFEEDILIIARSIFECYIFAKYFRENIDEKSDAERRDLINSFIVGPIGFSRASFDKRHKAGRIFNYTYGEEIIGKVLQTGELKDYLDDKEYYKDLYNYLCKFSHCNYGTLMHYLDFDGTFSLQLKKRPILTRLIVVFCYEKLIEGIITVEGEEFKTYAQEKSFYDLVYDSLELEKYVFDELIDLYKKYAESEKMNYLTDSYRRDGFEDNSGYYIYNMLSKMKSTLDNGLGSVNKSEFIDGKYKRYYPL